VPIEEVMAGQVFKGPGRVFKPDGPHKSLHVLGRRPKTKTLVTGPKAARASDMPQNPFATPVFDFAPNDARQVFRIRI
jgi:hypothetical protein